jgi:hypothetical protein
MTFIILPVNSWASHPFAGMRRALQPVAHFFGGQHNPHAAGDIDLGDLCKTGNGMIVVALALISCVELIASTLRGNSGQIC